MSNGSRPDIVADFRAAFETLKRYPVIAAPPLIAMAVGFVLKLVFLGAGAGMFVVGGAVGGSAGMAGALASGLFLFLIFIVLVMLLNLVAHAAVVVMARDATASREPSIGTAVDAVMSRLGSVAIAALIFSVIVGIASLFFVIPGLIAALFLMFTMPAVILDGLAPMDAVSRSFRLVKDNFGTVIGLVIGAIVAMVVLWVALLILGMVPVVGPLATMLLAGAFFAYLTAVGVRVYLALPRG
jgi:hypothetical protein